MPQKNYKIKTTFEADDKFSSRVGRMSRGMKALSRFADKAKRALKLAGRAAMFMGRQAARAAKVGLFAVTGAATAVFLAVNKLAAGMDSLAKTARSIDFPIEEFQEWRFVAEQAGVKSAVFDKSMQKFTRTIGELKGGYGSMFTALKKTDKPLLKQLQATDNVSDALQIYLGAIGGAGEATKKAALSAAGFGRAGIDMINIANESTESISKLRAQMRENGVVTAEQARKAEVYNDMMNRTKLTLKSVAVDALTPLMPLLTKGADMLRKWIGNNRALINQKVQEYFNKIKTAAMDAVKWIKENQEEIKSTVGEIIDLGKTVLKIIKFIWKARKGVLALGVALVGLKIIVASINFMNFMSGMTGASKAVTGFSNALGKAGLIAGSFLAGAAIGTALDQFVIQPMRDAADQLSIESENMAVRISMSIKKMNAAQLKSSAGALGQRAEKMSGLGSRVKAFLSGNLSEHEQAIKAVKESQVRVLQERLDRLSNANKIHSDRQEFGDLRGLQRGGGGDTSVFGTAAPQVQTNRSETTTTNRSELTIRDETGRAKLTKGKTGNGLELVSTGAM